MLIPAEIKANTIEGTATISIAQLDFFRCHPANYLEPFSSVYLDVLSGPNSVMVRLNGGYSA